MWSLKGESNMSKLIPQFRSIENLPCSNFMVHTWNPNGDPAVLIGIPALFWGG